MQKTFHTQTLYKKIPDQEELSELERRLQFHPSTTSDPQVLTCEQIEAISLAPLLAEAIRRVSEEESLSEMFV